MDCPRLHRNRRAFHITQYVRTIEDFDLVTCRDITFDSACHYHVIGLQLSNPVSALCDHDSTLNVTLALHRAMYYDIFSTAERTGESTTLADR